jgi:hypothetical protein
MSSIAFAKKVARQVNVELVHDCKAVGRGDSNQVQLPSAVLKFGSVGIAANNEKPDSRVSSHRMVSTSTMVDT